MMMFAIVIAFLDLFCHFLSVFHMPERLGDLTLL